jgi:hypothetical protein
MLCAPLWCNGLCSSVVSLFVFLGGVRALGNGLCSSVGYWFHKYRGTQTITPPRNTNHHTTEEQKPLHHGGTQTITPPDTWRIERYLSMGLSGYNTESLTSDQNGYGDLRVSSFLYVKDLFC